MIRLDCPKLIHRAGRLRFSCLRQLILAYSLKQVGFEAVSDPDFLLFETQYGESNCILSLGRDEIG